MKFSIREILLFVVLVGISLAGLTGGKLASLLALVVLATVMTGVVITAVVGRGDYRTFAIGSLIPLCVYWAEGHGWVNFHLHEVVNQAVLAADEWIPRRASNEDLDLSFTPDSFRGTLPAPGSAFTIDARQIRFGVLFRAAFGIAAGYVAGKFAVWVQAQTQAGRTYLPHDRD